ncbi:hypothetical protein HPB47_023375 [Ixodes persulcatus]|uniref:Uncharacterized protein n=1 Tax=Ixodes persulcatus TaxID=34615 RepID=A0AC60Q9H3_IXOPE|nr:hypothetical protein HPB47_023375 [Ixodes persulcatus]
MSLRGVVKLSLLGGTVYLAQTSGVWSDSSRTIESIKASVKAWPSLKYYVDTAPSRKELNMNAVDCWNDGVKATFKHLLSLPHYTKSTVAWCSKSISGLINQEKKP